MIEEKEQLVLDSRGVDGLFVDICELLFFERMALSADGAALLKNSCEYLFHLLSRYLVSVFGR